MTTFGWQLTLAVQAEDAESHDRTVRSFVGSIELEEGEQHLAVLEALAAAHDQLAAEVVEEALDR